MAGGDASLGSAALDPNFLMRELESIRQWQREMMPSVAASVSGIVSEITARFPVASVIPYAGATAPTGWLLADGAAVSRATYSDLFAVIGTTYGVGDGSTTFNVPNLKGRIPVGQDAAQAEFNVLGETGGEKTHTLSAGEMPSHTHTQDAHDHSYTDSTVVNSVFASLSGSGTYVHTGSVSNVGKTTGSATATNQNAGGDGAHNNLQPYIALPYIIKHYKY